MLDIGWTELLVIAVVLIVVVGPKDLPPMLRAFGKMTANLRKMAGEFRSQFDEALRDSDLDDVRKTISDAQRLNPTNALRDAINPLRQMSQEIRSDLERATKVATSAGGAGADSEALEAGGHETGDAADAGLPASGLGLEPDPARPVTPDVTPAAAAIPVTSSEVAEPSVPAVAPSPSVPATASAPAAAAAAAAPSSPVAESSVPKPKATRKPAARPKAAPAPLQEATSADLAPVPVKRKGSTRKTLAGTGEPQAPAPKRAPRKTNSPKDDA